VKNKTTAALLAFFLGWIGVHRFYLEQTGLGFLHLLFCWTTIPLWVSIVDFIVFLTMSKEAFDLKYNPTRVLLASTMASSSSAININMTNNNAKEGGPSMIEEIGKLNEMKEKGLLSEDEFQQAKTQLLNSGN